MKLTARSTNRARSVLVILLGLYSIALIAPDLAHCFLPKAQFGYIGAKYSGAVVTAVESGSAAAAAGIHVGDRIQTRSQTTHERLFVGTGRTLIPEMTDAASGTVPYAGERVTLRILRDGGERTVTLVARAHEPNSADIFWEIWGFACHAIRVVLGAALVLARPGLVTWAFYAYMLGLGFFGSSDYYNALPAALWIAVMIPQYVISGAAPASQALLWLVLPTGTVTGWRRWAIVGIVAGFGVGAALALAEMFSALGAYDTAQIESAWKSYDVGIGVIGMIALGDTVLRSHGIDRRLIGALFGITLLAYSAEATIITFELSHIPPLPVFKYVFLLGILLPLFIAYAIVRYQMFDVEYVLSRTIVVSILAVLLAGVFIGVDAFFAAFFYGSRGELALDIAIALGLGFATQSFYTRAIDLVDRLFFARRYDVRIKLKSIVDCIGNAESRQDIEKAITTDAGIALGLASAMFFESVEDGGYLRVCGYGWPAASLWNILPDDECARRLIKVKGALDLRAFGWVRTGQPAPYAPALAIPMRSAEGVLGAALYGDRLDGVLLSPDEVRALIELSQCSSAAYAFFGKASTALAMREMASLRTAP